MVYTLRYLNITAIYSPFLENLSLSFFSRIPLILMHICKYFKVKFLKVIQIFCFLMYGMLNINGVKTISVLFMMLCTKCYIERTTIFIKGKHCQIYRISYQSKLFLTKKLKTEYLIYTYYILTFLDFRYGDALLI